MAFRCVGLAVVLFVALGCQANPAAPTPTLDELRASPTSTSLDGVRIELQVSLNRDFMPIAPPDGQPLVASVQLPQPANAFSVDDVWVLFGSEMWRATPERIAGTTTWVARNGPKWGPGVNVDVVARVRSSSNRASLVRAADQPIGATR